jgi:putative Mg2+ transporter-C (MgtC) family protein
MNNTTNSINNSINNEHKYLNFNFDYFIISIIKSSLSVLFSFVIGFERELHSHPGGICTHTLVGLGSCLFTMISVHLRDMYPSSSADPARICAQIVSGMGFLGSATIFKSNNYVKGINTAANLWISAAVSMAIGADLWEIAVVISLYTVLILLLNNIYKRIRYKKRDNIVPNDSESSNSELSHDPQDAPYGDENESEYEEHID